MNNNDIKDLLITYRSISRLMIEHKLTKDNSFMRVKNFLANMICDNLKDGQQI